METIKVKCPNCSAILAVKKMPGMEEKTITCPVCHVPSQFSKCSPVIEKHEESTLYPKDISDGSKRQLSAVLRYQGHPAYIIKPGLNIVGRKAPNSSADYQIVDEGKRLSREHLSIEAKMVEGVGMTYYARLCKEKVNKTYINDEPLEFGDCIVLQNHDILKLPDANLIFELQDDEGTIY